MSGNRPESWLRPAVAAMSAYAVADAKGMVKLDAMENPYTLPDDLLEEWGQRLRQIDINRYPDPGAHRLKQLMRDRLALPADAGLVLGNGSDEIIQMLALALGGEGRAFLSVEPAFVMYRLIAQMSGLDYLSTDLHPVDFSIDLKATIGLIETHQPAVVFIANPNNPTGNTHSMETLEALAEAVPGLLVVDEAYAPFTDTTALPMLQQFNHVLVMRTVSKMGLAGLRLGYMLGHRSWTDELEKVRLPYNINVLSQQAAIFALQHVDVFHGQAARIRKDRESMFTSLGKIPGIKVWPSEANFLLFRVPEGQGPAIYNELKARNILIKSLTGGHPAVVDCLRVTVGSPQENEAFLTALRDILEAT